MIKPILNKLFWGFFRHFLSDAHYAKSRYWLTTGSNLNLAKPETFSEKINWLKLHDRTELRKKVADRLEAREFVRERTGSEYLIPLVGAYEKITCDIWEQLPDKFVLKANHGSGMIRIVKDKTKEDIKKIVELTEEWKRADYSKFGREWVYRELPKTIIVEKLLLTPKNDVPEDFKFFCYHGRVEFIQVDFDRYTEQKRNLYDRGFNKLDMRLLHENYQGDVQKPDKLSEAIEIAEKLSSDFNFIRVDLYLMEERVYFGEMTNFPGNGFEPFIPDYYDLHFGSLLKLDSPEQIGQ
jgi:hypothetical protein